MVTYETVRLCVQQFGGQLLVFVKEGFLGTMQRMHSENSVKRHYGIWLQDKVLSISSLALVRVVEVLCLVQYDVCVLLDVLGLQLKVVVLFKLLHFFHRPFNTLSLGFLAVLLLL